jgi:hypothetical protein
VYVKGSDVTFSITSPNYTDSIGNLLSITQPYQTTLLTKHLYKFSGENFNGTSSPLYIDSTRVKVNTQSFNYSSVTYTLKLNPVTSSLYYSKI